MTATDESRTSKILLTAITLSFLQVLIKGWKQNEILKSLEININLSVASFQMALVKKSRQLLISEHAAI